MKKLIIVLFLCIFCVVFSSCYYDSSKKNMELIEVKVYDSENNEVEGEYKDIYKTWLNELFKVSNDVKRVNSAAPVEKYYFVEGKKDEKYTVIFTFTSVNNYELTKLILTHDFDNYHKDHYGEEIECLDITKEEKNFIVKFEVEGLEEDTCLKTKRWEDNDSSHLFGTKGSNVYIKGVYFIVRNDD